MDRLTQRADFLRAAHGIRRVTPGLTLEICANGTNEEVRVGFTASRKIGGAVIRNRAKRRLRALAREILAVSGLKGIDYVLVARKQTAERPFESLKTDLAQALRAAHLKLGSSGEAR